MRSGRFGISAVAALVVGLSSGVAHAAPNVNAYFDGPIDSFSINLTIENLATSTVDIVSVLLDGSTANAFPILWDSPGFVINPPGATASFAGVDTQMLTINIADTPDGLNPGEALGLVGMDPDGDPGPAGVSVGELAGVRMVFTFRGGGTLEGFFVRDTSPRGGVRFEPVPEPGALALTGLGLASLAGYRWTRRRRAAA